MNCLETQEELVALIQHELSPEKEAEVQSHVEGCQGCRESLDQFRAVFKASKHVGMVEPSAEFRRTLERRIRDAVEHNKRSRRLARPGSSGVAAAAALPAPGGQRKVASRSAAIPAISSAHAKSAAPAARAPVARRRVWPFVSLAAAVVLLVAGICFGPSFRAPAPNPAREAQRQMQARSDARWYKRREAEPGQRWDKILNGQDLDLSEAAPAEVLYLVRSHDAATLETCVWAFSDADLARLRKEGRLSTEALNRLLQGAARVEVREGKCALLADWIASHLGGAGNRVAVLKLAGRLELWSSSALDRYLQEPPKAGPAPAPETPLVNGVPAELAAASQGSVLL